MAKEADNGTPSILDEIIPQNNDDAPQPEEENLEKAQESSNEGEEDENQEEENKNNNDIIITDDVVKQYPTLYSLKGKGLNDVLKAYDNAVRMASRNSNEAYSLKQEISKMSKMLEGIKTQGTKEEKEQEPPDLLEDPKGYARFLENRIQKIVEQNLSPLRSTVDNSVREQTISYIKNSIQSELGENVDVNELANNFINEYPKIAQDQSFQSNPQLIITSLVNYYRAKQFDTVGNKINEKAKEKVRQALSKQEKQTPESQASVRTKKKSDIPSVLQEIIEDGAERRKISRK